MWLLEIGMLSVTDYGLWTPCNAITMAYDVSPKCITTSQLDLLHFHRLYISYSNYQGQAWWLKSTHFGPLLHNKISYEDKEDRRMLSLLICHYYVLFLFYKIFSYIKYKIIIKYKILPPIHLRSPIWLFTDFKES